jgi:hypothetical protein
MIEKDKRSNHAALRMRQCTAHRETAKIGQPGPDQLLDRIARPTGRALEFNIRE